jgi:catechol 2,3-dioxygenase-like lactoylglutathione lyase family enzyme
MIIGSHVIVGSTDADADRAFFRDVLQFPHIEVGGGWVIFSLPPSEVAVHPDKTSDDHQLNLMCDDVKQFVADMKARGVETDPVEDRGWGLLTHVALPSGGKLPVYQARHAHPPAMTAAR